LSRKTSLKVQKMELIPNGKKLKAEIGKVEILLWLASKKRAARAVLVGKLLLNREL
jgi:hypothetical protein